MRRREVENENGNRLIYYEFDDEASENDRFDGETSGDGRFDGETSENDRFDDEASGAE